MGVQGLWSIIEPTGQPVSADSLRGKVIAVDVSIWLHQAVKGYRDKDGTPLPNAHLLGVFHRVCKLLHYGVKPVFVFDGGVPALKKQTMSSRRQKKIEASDKSEVARKKLLTNFLQQHLQRTTKTALPPSLRMAAKITSLASATSSKKSPVKKNPMTEDTSDLYELHQKLIEDEKFEEEEEMWSENEEEEDFDLPRNYYYADHFSTITSGNFDSLPLESQHEILFQMQESKKTNSWNKMAEMPREPDEFSSFQIDRLLKRRFLQKKIQSVQKEMGQRHIYVQNLDELAMYEAEFGTEVDEGQIVGSKDKGALLIKPKVISTPSEATNGNTNTNNATSSQPGTSGSSHSTGRSQSAERSKPSRPNETMEDYINLFSSSEEDEDDVMEISNSKIISKMKLSEEETNIQLAIQLSLNSAYHNSNTNQAVSESNNATIDEADTELEEAIQLSLRTNESTTRDENVKVLRNVTPPQKFSNDVENQSPRKMITEAEKSSFVNEFKISVSDDLASPCYKFLGWVGFTDKVSSNVISPLKSKSEPKKISSPITIISSSESDDDNFEEVEIPDQDNRGSEKEFEDERTLIHLIANLPPPPPPTLEDKITESRIASSGMKILINENMQLNDDDDLFADVFKDTYQQEQLCSNINSKVVPMSEELENEIAQPESNATTVRIAEFESDRGLDPVNEPLENDSENVNEKSEERVVEGITRTLGNIPMQQETSDQPKSVHMISMDYLQNQEKLHSERGQLQAEMGQQDRISTSITDQMYTEAQELLTLFGIPFVVSPMEAESQCAFLDSACLTDGTITDDSDIWLFGGLRVYKNFFSQGEKHVKLFQYADIVKKLHNVAMRGVIPDDDSGISY